MKKYRSYSVLQRALSALLCLSMLLSVASGTDFSELLRLVENASEKRSAPDTSDYINETLEHMWDSNNDGAPDEDFLNAARPNYACRGGAGTSYSAYGGVEYRTIFHVYAFEGDTICVGSSVYNSKLNLDHSVGTNTQDKGSVDVVMTDLNGNTRAIDIRNSQADGEEETNTTGYIPNWQTEWAAINNLHKEDGKFIGQYTRTEGTETKTYTYIPYTYTVTETGVYTFEFHSYNKGGNGDNPAKRSDPFEQGHTPGKAENGLIAALNLTVFDESGYEQHGRTYADFLSLEMDPVSDSSLGASLGVVDTYYVLTTDSYIYKMKFNNICPYTYNFFVNNTGIYDTATNEIIYKSVKAIENNLSNNTSIPQMGAYFKYPGTKDTELSKSYYIFLEYPDDDLYGHLYERAVQPDPATNIRFVDQVELPGGTKTPGAYVGVGGYFAFDVEEATTATLRLEFGGALSAYAYAPVEISGVVTPHSTNYFYWDGCDGNGTQIRAGTYNLNDIVFTVTTKAGEIHFPITDMESAPGGITFERMSHIYDKSGNQLDTPGNIYDLTKNLIYYDDSAIYYGENIASVGISENQVKNWISGKKTEDSEGRTYRIYDNMNANGGENKARQSQYIINNPTIKIGDHSHTTNIVQYFDSAGNVLDGSSQEDMIEYLNSDTYPVGLSTGGTTTTDYGIANYWTFIPSKPEHSKDTLQTITIVSTDDPLFNLIGRVFYDADNVTNGKGYFSDMNKTGEYLMNGVTVNLYKKTTDSGYDPAKTYVDSNGVPLAESNFAGGIDAYELVGTGKTSNGSYTFSGLKYDAANGTEYLYQVVKPNPSYNLTTGNMTAAENATTSTAYYYYANYTYDNSYKGTEIQKIKVGGTGIDPTKKSDTTTDNPNHTVCAVDVGYHYEILPRSLMLKKTWDVPEDPTTHVANHPNSVVYEVDYRPSSGVTGEYAFRTMSAITSWQYEDEYLPNELNGVKVEDYYVAAEYYIEDGKIYRHTFDYDSSSKKYHSFVGKVESAELTELNSLAGTTVENFSNISDLSILKQLKWSPVTSEKYRAVLDRNVGSDSTTVTITNSAEHGTIEIFKYSGANNEENALQGATFRVYELKDGATLGDIQKLVSEGNTEELRKYQVGSATTRANGRIAFPGLDPNEDYVVREVYPPAGYRILNEFYEVRSKDETLPAGAAENFIYKFNDENYVKVDVGNAPADSDFYILKRIEGRAWQENDSFSFTIINPFVLSAGTEMSSAEGIRVDALEMNIVGEEKVREEAEKFANNFKAGKTNNQITVTDSNDYYSFSDEDTHGSGEQIEYTYPDRKMSEKLLTDGKGTGEGSPTFCEVEFPMAGVYTFTITENDIESVAKDTLTKSPLEYTVTINVTRVRNAETGETDELTKTNSHLEAEISSITYKDTSVSDSVSQIYAGSSPLFTNIYAPAPAKQDTSYNIVKKFEGRTDDEWLSTDNFTVRVSGVDTETQDAIKNGNIVINGFDGALDSLKNEWVHEFNASSHSEWNFESFTFNDIIFPVQYVKNDNGEVWNPDEHGGAISPPEGEINNYTPQTLPVTYWLKIEEDVPTETNGITYDSNVYYLQIILRNAEAKVSVGSPKDEGEEEDGIIDEIDMKLYHVANSKTTNDLKDSDIVATCYTQAEVLNESEWIKSVKVTDYDNESYAWFWVDSDGGLHEVETTEKNTPPSTVPDDAKLLVRRHEVHTNTEGTDGHTMTFSNEYHTSYAWTPTVEKVLNGTGREWLDTDKFTFEIKCTDTDISGVEMPTETTIEISQGTKDHKALFSPITFSKPGEYHFTITETDATKKELATYNVIVNVTDMGNGKLEPTISGSGAINDGCFQFINTYESTSFNLEISKTIIGRKWKEDDEFTFKITPDTNTKTAIADKIITIPEDTLGPADATGSYTVTIGYDSDKIDDDNKITKSLGEVVIENITAIAANTRYKFTITEVTNDLEEMYCREPSIDLFITVNTNETDPTSPTYKSELVATYAHRVSSDTESTATPTDSNVTIPFENVALGKLTVAKKVVTNAGTDSTEFGFTVEFTYADENDHKITVSGAEITSSTRNTLTYSFTLKDSQQIVFSNIPPQTQYTITETSNSEYMLLRVRDHKTDDGDIVSLTRNQVSGTITGEGTDNQQYRLFVNGLIKELPSSGGLGTKGYVFFGTALTVGAIALLAVFYFRRRKYRNLSE